MLNDRVELITSSLTTDDLMAKHEWAHQQMGVLTLSCSVCSYR